MGNLFSGKIAVYFLTPYELRGFCYASVVFRSSEKSPGRVEAVERLTQWTRERFKLDRDGLISVSEITCPLPGCPPLETVVAFWIGEQRHQFKVFKALAAVAVEDLPYAWLRASLAVSEGFDYDCC